MAEENQTEETDDLLDEGEVAAPKKDEETSQKEGAQEGVDKDSTSDLSSETGDDLLSDDEDAAESSDETSYEFEAPDDLKDIEFSDEALAAFKDVAKELGLSQDQFQKLAEFDARNAVAAQQAAVEQHREVVAGWKQQVLSDKDIGGENLSGTRQNAKAAIDKYADPELKQLLLSQTEKNPDGTGLGNHPAVMKFLNRIGKALADPDFQTGEEPPSDTDTLKRMYPSMYKNEAA